MKYTNVVLVDRIGCSKPFLCEIPLGENLKAGTEVSVGFIGGHGYGECATDSMWVNEGQLQFIMVANAASLPLFKVVGRFSPIKFEEVNVCGNALETADQP